MNLRAYADRSGLFDVASFRAFLEQRPDGERWELVDGHAMQSASPRIGHQRIASNFERHLNAVLRVSRPEWRADREIGIEVSSSSKDRPEPEVTVIDRDADPDRTYASRFYLVMEVPSASDRGAPLDAKIRFYKGHPANLFVIVVEQDRCSVTIHRRTSAATWSAEELTDLEAVIDLAGIGIVCKVAELYENTRFDSSSYPAPSDRP